MSVGSPASDVPKRFTLIEASAFTQLKRSSVKRCPSRPNTREAEQALPFTSQRIRCRGVVVNPWRVLKPRSAGSPWEGLAAIEKIQEYGCVIKISNIGLVDFPDLFRRPGSHLCWKDGRIRRWLLARRR